VPGTGELTVMRRTMTGLLLALVVHRLILPRFGVFIGTEFPQGGSAAQ
jgi:hypothetical protein